MRGASIRAERTDALVLRTIDYGESDRVVTLLTRAHGKVAVLARGARKSKRRFAGALEPFAILDAEIAIGHGDLGRVYSATVRQTFTRIVRDLSAMWFAGGALDFVREMTEPRHPDDRLFRTTLELLARIDAMAGTDAPHVLPGTFLAFVLRVLATTGLAPRLAECAKCGKHPGEMQAVLFDARRGAIICRGCGGAAHRLSGVTRAEIVASCGAGWATRTWDGAVVDEASAPVLSFASDHLGRDVTLPRVPRTAPPPPPSTLASADERDPLRV